MALLYSKVFLPFVPTAVLALAYPFVAHGRLPVTLIHPDFAERYRTEVARLRSPSLRELAGVRRTQQRMLENGHLTKRIESWATTGAQSRLEYRYPLLDRRILEFALGIPADQYNRQGWKRSLIRRAMANILPEEIRWEPSKKEQANWAVVQTVLPQLSHSLLDRAGPNIDQHPAAAYVDIARLRKEVMLTKEVTLDRTGIPLALSCFQIEHISQSASDGVPLQEKIDATSQYEPG